MATRRTTEVGSRGAQVTVRAAEAVRLLKGLTLQDVHQVLAVLPGVVHEHELSLEPHGTVEAARKRGFLHEVGQLLNQADQLLRDALRPI